MSTTPQTPTPNEPAFDDDLPEGFTQVVREVNGTLIHSVVGGAGEPVVLLHGWPQTWREWRYMLRPLADLGYTVIAPDLRGTGGSAVTEAGYDRDNQARDVHELLQALGLTGPVRMVGHDIGGMVAFSYARLYPEKVHKLALVDLAVPGYGLEEIMDPASGGLFHLRALHDPRGAGTAVPRQRKGLPDLVVREDGGQPQGLPAGGGRHHRHVPARPGRPARRLRALPHAASGRPG
ncbi:alpha/beta fold hydrolase [Streptomyces scopuliridis]|uniref:alpha/beta fold hydrolase n=1 Tax=Streptomyces scopuliridis TaxID=452529 RepID=UPI00398D63F0